MQLQTFFDTCLPSTPSPVLESCQGNLAHPQHLDWCWPCLSHQRSWKLRTLPHNMTHYGVWWHPQLSRQHHIDHIIHAEIPVTHNLQWDSPKPPQWETPGQNTQLSIDTPPDVQWWWVKWVKHRCIRQPYRSHDRFSTPTSSTRPGHTAVSSSDAPKQTSSAPDWLPVKDQNRSHHHTKDVPEVTRHPPD